MGWPWLDLPGQQKAVTNCGPPKAGPPKAWFRQGFVQALARFGPSLGPVLAGFGKVLQRFWLDFGQEVLVRRLVVPGRGSGLPLQGQGPPTTGIRLKTSAGGFPALLSRKKSFDRLLPKKFRPFVAMAIQTCSLFLDIIHFHPQDWGQ